jgi:predicted ribosomally synthesized peptide with SipW-like signal peptide
MNKILMSVLSIAVVGALTVGATLAVFNDQEAILGNTVATGDFSLTLGHSEGVPYNLPDVFPGFLSEWESIDITNEGPTEFDAYLGFSKTAGSRSLYNALTIKLVAAGEDGTCDTIAADADVIYEGKLKSAFHHGGILVAEDVAAESTVRVCQQLGVKADADNSIMGKTVVFSEIVNAMQNNH